MLASDHFDTLFLLARPAAGKSEIIHFLKSVEIETRLSCYHISHFQEIDDFPMLWTWFEEDDLLTQMGYPRLHSTPDGTFLNPGYWNLLIRRISLEYHKRLRDFPDENERGSTIIEFSRGSEHGGYREAFNHLCHEILQNAAILYVQVSFQESLRKNRLRFNPERPDSILQHGLTDEKLRTLYQEVDWEELTEEQPDYLSIQGIRVPYVVFDNEQDLTTHPDQALKIRLESCCEKLWNLYQARGN